MLNPLHREREAPLVAGGVGLRFLGAPVEGEVGPQGLQQQVRRAQAVCSLGQAPDLLHTVITVGALDGANEQRSAWQETERQVEQPAILTVSQAQRPQAFALALTYFIGVSAGLLLLIARRRFR